VPLHVEVQTGLGLEARTTLTALEPSLCQVFAFVGGQVAPFPECHATHITRMGILLPVLILTIILIIAFINIATTITTTTTTILLLDGYWLTLGFNSCPLQGTQVSGRSPVTHNIWHYVL
jgi:hypothetical protein